MNLQPKILSNAFLINGYTPAVDMILVILCILLLLLLRETFIRRSRLFLLFRTCIALLLIAAFSNSCFYYTVLYFDSDTTLCILRAIYHSSLLLIFCLYAAYLKILIGIPGKTGHIMNIFLYSLYIIFAVVDALSPVLGYSFYRDSSGAYTIQAITTTLYALGVSTEQAPVYKAVIVIIIVAIQAPPFKDYMKKMSAKRQLAKGGVA